MNPHPSPPAILITGATGNVGSATLRWLHERDPEGTRHRLVAGARDPDRDRSLLPAHRGLECVHFDFEDPKTFAAALNGIHRLFLLRPPQLSQVNRYFKPLIEAVIRAGIREVVFLSVQGAEKSSVIPHNKIERLILDAGLDHVFLRPSYFMQNLTTTLGDDIRRKRVIDLPAGHAQFNWIDVENIGEVAALVLDRFQDHRNQVLELTGTENVDFEAVTRMLNAVLDPPVRYRDRNPLLFYLAKRKEGMPHGKAIVLILLHFLQRYQDAPRITDTYRHLTGKMPTTLQDFLVREKSNLALIP